MTVIPVLWEAETEGTLEPWSLRLAWPIWQSLVSAKNTKISWAWWRIPIVPATQEAEVRGCIQFGRLRLR